MLLDELKQKFAVLNVQGLGECIVVPGAEFNPDWEAEIDNPCINDVLDGSPVTFIQLQKSLEQVQRKGTSPFCWNTEEDTYLISLWQQGFTVKEISEKIAEKYPLRQGVAAKQRLGRLQALGVVKPRKIKLSRKKSEVKTELKNQENGFVWSTCENDLLTSLWNRTPHLTITELLQEFQKVYPERTKASLTNHIWRLQKQGKIAPRFSVDKKEAVALDCNATGADACAVVFTASEVQQLKIEALERSVAVLLQAYDAQSKACVELKTGVDNLLFAVGKASAFGSDLEELSEHLAKHKHAVTGEAMLPMEAQA